MSRAGLKVAVIGGGPAGLYFALLLQQRFPHYRVTVFEQNPRDATYGWGVVFSTIAFLKGLDPAFFSGPQHIAFVHRGETVRLEGNRFYRVARIDLLRILQERCTSAGVNLVFKTRITEYETLLAEHDLVVAADGAYSATRTRYAEHFGTTLDVRPNQFIWYGTERLFDPVTLIFQPTAHGVFVGHAYRYTEDRSSFVAECSPQTWQRAGLDRMSEEESRRHCEEVFADSLQGHELLVNRSLWFNCVIVRNVQWSYRNLVLLGDAVRTGHPSIGAGTRLAMGDSLALFEACERHGADIPAVLADYERSRRPKSAALQEAAVRSARWYETVEQRMHFDPPLLAYSFLMRTGRVRHEDLWSRDRGFVERFERYLGIADSALCIAVIYQEESIEGQRAAQAVAATARTVPRTETIVLSTDQARLQPDALAEADAFIFAAAATSDAGALCQFIRSMPADALRSKLGTANLEEHGIASEAARCGMVWASSAGADAGRRIAELALRYARPRTAA